MGGFHLQYTGADADPAGLASAEAQFARHGFAAPRRLAVPGWAIRHWDAIAGGPAGFVQQGTDWAAAAGTISVDGRFGAPALAALLAMIDPARPTPLLDWDRLTGEFALVLHRGGRTFLIGDFFGTWPVYRDLPNTLFSTSFLAAAQAQPRLRFDTQAVYEFAFNVVPVGDDTVFAEIRTLAAGSIVELLPDGASTTHGGPRPLPEAPVRMPLGERIAQLRAPLEAQANAIAAQFGNAVHAPLSGGLDSRLVLALLRAAGVRPQVYVYGPETSADVRVARAIGAELGFDVAWTDKNRAPITPDAFPGQVATNFDRFDGLPNFGNLFDNGGNAAALDARHTAGALAISGGCGEVFRDFFFLADRRMRAGAVTQSFFARFLADDLTSAFDRDAFLGAITAKLRAALGAGGRDQPLSRTRIEQLYPRVRCRSLFGREIAIEGRHGPYAMPFLDHRVVAAALQLPMRLKQAGAFEAALIAAIDPVLAAQPSAYGHAFDVPPGFRHRLAEWSTRLRPPWLRAQSYALQRRLRPMTDEHGGLLSPDYLGRVIDLDLPVMRRWFRVERIADSALLRRIACLEYLAARLGGRLDPQG